MRFQPWSTVFYEGESFEVSKSDSLTAYLAVGGGVDWPVPNEKLAKAQEDFWESFAPAPKPPRKMTIQEAARTALAVQDACNLSGVQISFGLACDAVREDLHSRKEFDTPNFNRHPVVVLFLDKMASLAGLCPVGPDDYGRTWDACKRLVNKGDSDA